MKIGGGAAQEVVGFFVGQVTETEDLADFAGRQELAEFGRDILGIMLEVKQQGGEREGGREGWKEGGTGALSGI